MLWVNPSYSRNVATNIAKKFLKLIDNRFPYSHKCNKIFNRKTVNVSYNLKSIKLNQNKNKNIGDTLEDNATSDLQIVVL